MQVAKCMIKTYILIQSAQLNMMSAKNGSDCKGYLTHGLLTEGKTLLYHWHHACNIQRS